jgi:hypothetical protein
MQYNDYIALYQAQKEREAQLVSKYSDKPEPVLNKALWSITTVERHDYTHGHTMLQLIACVGIFGAIILAYCIFA